MKIIRFVRKMFTIAPLLILLIFGSFVYNTESANAQSIVGCLAGYNYNVNTGVPCNPNIPPAGCAPSYIYSIYNGRSCANPYLPVGCLIGYKYSTSTGKLCNLQ